MDDILAGMAEEEVAEAPKGPSLVDQILADIDDSVLERAEPFAEREGQVARGLGRLALKGATFGMSDVVGKANDIEKWARGQGDIQRAQTEYPIGSMAAEIVGSLPTSGGLFAAGKAVGASPAVIGAVEGAAYGLGTEGVEGGLIGGVAGFAGGKAIDALVGKMASAASKGEKYTPTAAEKKMAMDGNADNITDKELFEELTQANKREMIKNNRRRYDKAEDVDRRIAQHKDYVGPPTFKVTDDLTPPTANDGFTIADAWQYAEDVYGITNRNITDIIRKGGGLKISDDVTSAYKPTVMEVLELDKMFTKSGSVAPPPGQIMQWYEKTFLPVVDVVRKYYDPKVAAQLDKSYDTTTRRNAFFTDTLMKPMENVFEYVNNNVAAKKLLLDLHETGDVGFREFRLAIAKDLGKKDLRAFDKFWKYTSERNEQARKSLFIDDGAGWDELYIHTQKRSQQAKGEGNPFETDMWRPKYDKVDSLRTRTRELTKDMTDEEILDYENPLLSHSKYVTDQENMLQMTENFGLRPSIATGGTENDLYQAIAKRLRNDGWGKKEANEAAGLMLTTYQGSKKAPPPAVRAFMNLSYAGTLAQFRSAVLNTHDIAVSMVNNGVRPTMKAILSNMDGEFGKRVRDMLGDQNFGEFIRDYDRFTNGETWLDKTGMYTRKFSDGAMLVSGFRAMDELGKGVVLRASVENYRALAKAGKFLEETQDFLLDPGMATKVNRYLKSGVPVKEMPLDVAEVIEDLAFAKLGEQQLINAAGRPLGYLSNPLFRPAYAMTGFAIKQQAMLRKNVLDKIKAGKPTEAAAYAAKYVAYAGMGYGFINETRNAIFKGDDFEPADILLGTLDQVAAAISLNRLGDEYSRQMFEANPVEFLMTSFLPPGGMVEGMGRALTGDIGKFIERVPAVGGPLKAAGWTDIKIGDDDDD
jgi:hypothetical protein